MQLTLPAVALFVATVAASSSKFVPVDANEFEILAASLNQDHGHSVFPTLDRKDFDLHPDYDLFLDVQKRFPDSNLLHFGNPNETLRDTLLKGASMEVAKSIEQRYKADPAFIAKEMLNFPSGTTNVIPKIRNNVRKAVSADFLGRLGRRFPHLARYTHKQLQVELLKGIKNQKVIDYINGMSNNDDTWIANTLLSSPTTHPRPIENLRRVVVAEVAKSPHVEKLQNLLAMYFPQFGEVQYQRIEVEGSGHFASRAGAMSLVQYRCRALLFGMPIETRTVYAEWDTAKEAAAQSAFTILAEFLRLVHGRTDDPMFGKMFAPLVKELEAYRQQPVPMLLEEQAAIDAGHQPVIRLTDYDKGTEAKERVLGPLLSAVYAKVTNPNDKDKVPASPEADQPKATTAMDVEPASVSRPPDQNPMSVLYTHCQKSNGKLAKPEFTDFRKDVYFGAIGTYAGEKVAVAAVYRKKQEAFQEAARLLCERILGNVIQFKPIPADCTGPTLVDAQNFIVANSIDVVTNTIKVQSAASTSVKELEEWQRELPSGPASVEYPPGGQKFVSLVNEFCQIMGMPGPNFTTRNVNASLSLSYCCIVDNFYDKKYVSYAFQKKQEAKEDCAARIFQDLKDRGLVNERGKAIKQPRSATRAPIPMPFPPRLPSQRSSRPTDLPFSVFPPPIQPGMPDPIAMMHYHHHRQMMAAMGASLDQDGARSPQGTPPWMPVNPIMSRLPPIPRRIASPRSRSQIPPLHTLHPQFGRSDGRNTRKRSTHERSSRSRSRDSRVNRKGRDRSDS
ncbi:hypothetical protein PSACC_03272 [Paramicrosporidium saccamoebae]|uniref:DRBM domain-containing protein n=1 Tax=Paramicrosporidium saccamoebae TaxID=1246581 RepID=A0A2H9TGT5_9FUNG|nr:hypothetical protein PSACC_03272 [Paramicrosporidium saccamoebae]